MKFLSKRAIGMALAGVMAVSALSGCTGAKKTASSGGEVTYWVALDPLVSQSVNNFGETPIGKALSERTGVNVKWIHPAQGQGGEKFNLMVASNDLTDIVGDTQSMMEGAATVEAVSLSQSLKYAVIIVSTVPILLVYPFMQKYFVKGVMIGSVKG